jgi:hypothetical protein
LFGLTSGRLLELAIGVARGFMASDTLSCALHGRAPDFFVPDDIPPPPAGLSQ